MTSQLVSDSISVFRRCITGLAQVLGVPGDKLAKHKQVRQRQKDKDRGLPEKDRISRGERGQTGDLRF